MKKTRFFQNARMDRNAVSDALDPPPHPPLRAKPPAWFGLSPRWIASPLKYPGYGPEIFLNFRHFLKFDSVKCF